MRKTLPIFLLLITAGYSDKLHSQILTVGPDGFTISQNTIFSADSIMLTPSVDFNLANFSLNKAATVTNSTVNVYIARVYKFNGSSSAFTGSIQINYQDGAELNGLMEPALQLNVHNGSIWNAYSTTASNTTSNYVTADLTGVLLNELTLADVAHTLPLTWESFTAEKQNRYVLLKWTTAGESNTRNFIVQHSGNGNDWNNLGTIAASGNSSNNYTYLHTDPIKNNNYYRILQSDMDGRYNYSDIKMVKFTSTNEAFTVIGNPVTNNILTVKINTPTTLALYDRDGKMVWQKLLNAGTQTIDVSPYAKGIYLLKGNTTVEKIAIK